MTVWRGNKAKSVSQHLRSFVSCQLKCWPFVAHSELLVSSCNLSKQQLLFRWSFSSSLLSEIMLTQFSEVDGEHQLYASVDEFLNSSYMTA